VRRFAAFLEKPTMTDRFIGEAECHEVTSLSRVTRWRMERDGTFPKRRQISPNRLGWLHSEVQAWVEARANGQEAIAAPATAAA